MESVDVLIVGGGPAGLSVASSFGGSGVLVHQDREIGWPVRTSGGTWLSDMVRLEVPPRLYHVVRSADLFSDHAHATLDLSPDPVCILDVTALYRWLADRARVEIRLATKFLGVRREGDGFVARLRGPDRAEYDLRARRLVDASGWHSVVLDALGLGRAPTRRGIGIEYEFAAPDHDPNRAALFFGRSVPTGYGWAFPTREGHLRLGVGVIEPVTDRSPRDVMDALLASGALARMGLPEPAEYHVNAGILPSEAFGGRLSWPGVTRLGDSANMATPVLGEGIRMCIEQGRALGAALTEGREAAWARAAHRRFVLPYRVGFWANRRAARYGPEDWDRSVARMARLPPDELIAFLRNDFPPKAILRRTVLEIRRKLGLG